MTREKALKQLSECVEEDHHGNADDILCELLISLGYLDVVNAYNKVPKWYE